MGRYFVWALGVGSVVALSAAPAAAQVDIGVWTRNIGGRVIVGSPRVYVPPPVYVEPVYVEPVYVVQPRVYVERDYYYRPYYRVHPGKGRGHAKFSRGYYDRYPSRVYRVESYRRPYYRDNRRGDRYRRW